MSTEQAEIQFVGSDMIKAQAVQSMADDMMVVNAARVSFNAGFQHMGALNERDTGLVNFLMKNHHGTPFEHNEFTFLVTAPIVVAREHMRHRVGHSYNEWSARYSKLDPVFYVPEQARIESHTGKPYEHLLAEDMLTREMQKDFREHMEAGYRLYERYLARGVKREMARGVLPVYTFTKYYWTCNARSLMHFIALRNAPDAMYEISLVAADAEHFFERAMPVTYAAFVEHGRVAP